MRTGPLPAMRPDGSLTGGPEFSREAWDPPAAAKDDPLGLASLPPKPEPPAEPAVAETSAPPERAGSLRPAVRHSDPPAERSGDRRPLFGVAQTATSIPGTGPLEDGPLGIGRARGGLLADLSNRNTLLAVAGIALGLVVDDTIHLLHRYREARLQGAFPERAVAAALSSAGRPVVVTSVALALGFAAFGAAPFRPTRDFGLLTAATATSALALDLLLLPALLLLPTSLATSLAARRAS